MAQKVLQAGLSMGMSAVSGAYSSQPQPLPEDYNGLKRGKDGNDVQVPLLCWGAWPWGDTSTFHWSDDESPDLRAAWKKCLENGLTFVDTAQVYGSGKSEEILADLIHNYSPGVDRSKIIVQTKWLPNVTDQGTNVLQLVDAPFKQLQKTLDRMKLTHIDCYPVHGHIHISSIKQVAQGLAKCVEEGLAKTVGVANYSVKDMLRMKEAFSRAWYSTRHQPVLGRLSGKYGKDNPPPKEYRFSYDMERVEPCLRVQRKLAVKHNVNVTAAALNWNICKGAIPVVGLRKGEQAV
ncbi:NADP-dependent oxidoreductase domain-containing protein [Xylaria telfairii]|nr:NADP-dependent oxidoreductase domain-containing protein [Xylaria telfairii]